MKCTLSNVLYFATGAAIGSLVTWKFLKKKYEKIARDSIDEVVDRLLKKQEVTIDPDQVKMNLDEVIVDEEEFVPTPEELEQYANYAKRYGDHPDEKKETEEVVPVDGPYVISPEMFGENSEYETISLTYYADGVLTDEWDNVIDDVEDMIGANSLNTFGDYEPDSVFVRDDEIKTDYEILADERAFADVKRTRHEKLGGN